MKIKHIVTIMIIVMFCSCKKYDDTELWKVINDNSHRIAVLEALCSQMNEEINNLRTIVQVLQNNDFVTDVSPLVDGSGYSVSFSQSGTIVIKNGRDGNDGIVPIIGVERDTDGLYYWTLNGVWLLSVDGEKIIAQGVDGVNGSDGITPLLRIDDGFWFVSYDSGMTWVKLVKAIEDSGLCDIEGNTVFKSVNIVNNYVVFTLRDDSTIRIPYGYESTFVATVEIAGNLSELLTFDQRKNIRKMVVKGKINLMDMRYIQTMNSLEELDLSSSIFEDDHFSINPYQDTLVNRSITKVVFPTFTDNVKYMDYSYCVNLEHVVVTNVAANLQWGYEYNGEEHPIAVCPVLDTIEYSEGITNILKDPEHSFYYYKTGKTRYNSYSNHKKYILPSTTASVDQCFMRAVSGRESQYAYKYNFSHFQVVCKASIPPTVSWYSSYVRGELTFEDCVLYVPEESINAYKLNEFWGKFEIFSIE